MRRETCFPAVPVALTAAVVGAMALAGCHPKQAAGPFGVHVDGEGNSYVGIGDGHPKAPSSLTCPQQVNELSRTAQAADGKSCAYSGRDGETVELDLTALGGQTPQARLASLEGVLKGQLGPLSGSAVHIDADGDHDKANIDLPGFHLHADGDKADIQMPGVHIDANGDKAQVNTGWGLHKAVVNADSNGAEVRAGDVTGGSANLTYVLASSKPGPTGLRAAGYIAQGPAAGPLVVGVFRTPDTHQGHELNDSGLQRLMRINTGRG